MSFHERKSVQEEVEGRDVSKVTLCFSRKTPGDTDLQLDEDNRGNFRRHSEEVVVHAGMRDFHRRLVSSTSVNATHAPAILAVNIDKKREILLAVSSKDRKYRSDRMAARIVANIISK